MELVLGLAGIIATLIASGLGLYFTYRARTSTYRETLYSKQIEFLLDAAETINEVKSAVSAVQNAEDEGTRSEAWHEIQRQVLVLADTLPKAAILLPTELYVALSKLHQSAVDFLLIASQETEIESAYHSFIGLDVRFALLVREFIGVDALSEESMNLFSKRSVNQVLKVPVDDFASASRLLSGDYRESD